MQRYVNFCVNEPKNVSVFNLWNVPNNPDWKYIWYATKNETASWDGDHSFYSVDGQRFNTDGESVELCDYPCPASQVTTNSFANFSFNETSPTGNNFYIHVFVIMLDENGKQICCTYTVEAKVVECGEGCRFEILDCTNINKQQTVNFELTDDNAASATNVRLISNIQAGPVSVNGTPNSQDIIIPIQDSTSGKRGTFNINSPIYPLSNIADKMLRFVARNDDGASLCFDEIVIYPLLDSCSDFLRQNNRRLFLTTIPSNICDCANFPNQNETFDNIIELPLDYLIQNFRFVPGIGRMEVRVAIAKDFSTEQEYRDLVNGHDWNDSTLVTILDAPNRTGNNQFVTIRNTYTVAQLCDIIGNHYSIGFAYQIKIWNLLDPSCTFKCVIGSTADYNDALTITCHTCPSTIPTACITCCGVKFNDVIWNDCGTIKILQVEPETELPAMTCCCNQFSEHYPNIIDDIETEFCGTVSLACGQYIVDSEEPIEFTFRGEVVELNCTPKTLNGNHNTHIEVTYCKNNIQVEKEKWTWSAIPGVNRTQKLTYIENLIKNCNCDPETIITIDGCTMHECSGKYWIECDQEDGITKYEVEDKFIKTCVCENDTTIKQTVESELCEGLICPPMQYTALAWDMDKCGYIPTLCDCDQDCVTKDSCCDPNDSDCCDPEACYDLCKTQTIPPGYKCICCVNDTGTCVTKIVPSNIPNDEACCYTPVGSKPSPNYDCNDWKWSRDTCSWVCIDSTVDVCPDKPATTSCCSDYDPAPYPTCWTCVPVTQITNPKPPVTCNAPGIKNDWNWDASTCTWVVNNINVPNNCPNGGTWNSSTCTWECEGVGYCCNEGNEIVTTSEPCDETVLNYMHLTRYQVTCGNPRHENKNICDKSWSLPIAPQSGIGAGTVWGNSNHVETVTWDNEGCLNETRCNIKMRKLVDDLMQVCGIEYDINKPGFTNNQQDIWQPIKGVDTYYMDAGVYKYDSDGNKLDTVYLTPTVKQSYNFYNRSGAENTQVAIYDLTINKTIFDVYWKAMGGQELENCEFDCTCKKYVGRFENELERLFPEYGTVQAAKTNGTPFINFVCGGTLQGFIYDKTEEYVKTNYINNIPLSIPYDFDPRLANNSNENIYYFGLCDNIPDTCMVKSKLQHYKVDGYKCSGNSVCFGTTYNDPGCQTVVKTLTLGQLDDGYLVDIQNGNVTLTRKKDYSGTNDLCVPGHGPVTITYTVNCPSGINGTKTVVVNVNGNDFTYDFNSTSSRNFTVDVKYENCDDSPLLPSVDFNASNISFNYDDTTKIITFNGLVSLFDGWMLDSEEWICDFNREYIRYDQDNNQNYTYYGDPTTKIGNSVSVNNSPEIEAPKNINSLLDYYTTIPLQSCNNDGNNQGGLQNWRNNPILAASIFENCITCSGTCCFGDSDVYEKLLSLYIAGDEGGPLELRNDAMILKVFKLEEQRKFLDDIKAMFETYWSQIKREEETVNTRFREDDVVTGTTSAGTYYSIGSYNIPPPNSSCESYDYWGWKMRDCTQRGFDGQDTPRQLCPSCIQVVNQSWLNAGHKTNKNSTLYDDYNTHQKCGKECIEDENTPCPDCAKCIKNIALNDGICDANGLQTSSGPNIPLFESECETWRHANCLYPCDNTGEKGICKECVKWDYSINGSLHGPNGPCWQTEYCEGEVGYPGDWITICDDQKCESPRPPDELEVITETETETIIDVITTLTCIEEIVNTLVQTKTRKIITTTVTETYTTYNKVDGNWVPTVTIGDPTVTITTQGPTTVTNSNTNSPIEDCQECDGTQEVITSINTTSSKQTVTQTQRFEWVGE